MADDLLSSHNSLQRRLFGPRTMPPPGNRPGLETRDISREIVQGRQDDGAKLDLSDADKARADYLIKALGAFIQNANITVSQPAHNEPNLWSTPIDLSAQVVVPAAVGDYVPVISYKVQPGRWLRIKGYGVDVSDPAGYTYDGSLLWRIRKNGINVETLADWGEHRGSVIRPRETFLLASGDVTSGDGDVVTFEVRRAVAAAVTATVQMALVGYTWRPRNNYEGTKAGTTAY